MASIGTTDPKETMVHANYDLFDADYAEKVRTSHRPGLYAAGGYLGKGQDEAQLQDSVLRDRDGLLQRLEWLEDDPAAEAPGELQLQRIFLRSMAVYMGVIPGALTSVWGPTTPKDWAEIARKARYCSESCKAEVQRTMAPFYDLELWEKTSYAGIIDRTGYLLELVAIHFEEAVAAADSSEPAAV